MVRLGIIEVSLVFFKYSFLPFLFQVLSPLLNSSIAVKYSFNIPKRGWARHKDSAHRQSSSVSRGASQRKHDQSASTAIPVSHYFDVDDRRVSPTATDVSNIEKNENTMNEGRGAGSDKVRSRKAGGNAPFIKLSNRNRDKQVVYIPPEINEDVVTQRGDGHSTEIYTTSPTRTDGRFKIPLYQILVPYFSLIKILREMRVAWAPGANFTNRLKLSQLSLCIRFKPQNRLKSVHEIRPRAHIHKMA